jgi:hypothetical protein
VLQPLGWEPATIIGQVSTATAQYYPPGYYGPRDYDRGPGYYPGPPPRYAQPMGWGDPYPANMMVDCFALIATIGRSMDGASAFGKQAGRRCALESALSCRRWLVSWDRPFDKPIPLPSGPPARTLRDAGNYIRSLPKSERDTPEWRLAVQMLIDAAEDRGPMLFAKIGMLRAIERHSKSDLGSSANANPSLRRKAQTERRSLRSPRIR